MRVGFAVAVAACVAGCSTAQVASRAGEPAIRLSETGLGPSGSPLQIDFGRAQDGVISAVTALQGEGPRSSGVIEECGAGPVYAANWDNGLTLNFQNEQFLGWVAQLPFQANYPEGAVALSTPREALTSNISPDQTPLGEEFFAGGIWHLIGDDGNQVSTVWSGLTCFFR